MAGFDGRTGEVLDGFAHVEQSIEKILTTAQGERVMREWFGNPGLRLLGENMTEATILVWFNTVWALIELYEPRFEIVQFKVDDLQRIGTGEFTFEGRYREYAHLDFVQAQAFVSIEGQAVRIETV